MPVAVGIEQLKRLDGILAERRELAAGCGELLEDIPNIELLKTEKNILSNWQSYPVRLLDRDYLGQIEVMQRLLDEGIATRRGIMNAHQEQAYNAEKWSLPKSELCRDRTILLPLFPGITRENLDHVSNTLHLTLVK